jgi:curved DNA-binding protein CbpA
MTAEDIVKSRRVYQVLGLPDFAAADDAKRAFRELALLHHPDKNRSDPEAVERFKVINAAYQLLSDEAKKANYDAALSAARVTEARLARTEAMMADARKATGFARTPTHYAEELNSFRDARRSQSQGASMGRPRAAATAASAAPTTPAAKNQYSAGSAAASPSAHDGAGRAASPEAAPADGPSPTADANQPSAYSNEQTEIFRRREKEREREVARRLEREKEEKREKEIEKMKRLQAQKQAEEERRKREHEKLREKISRVFSPSPAFGPGGAAAASGVATATSPINATTTAASIAADIRGRAAASAAAAKAGRSGSRVANDPTTPRSASGAPPPGRATAPVPPPYTAPTAAAATTHKYEQQATPSPPAAATRPVIDLAASMSSSMHTGIPAADASLEASMSSQPDGPRTPGSTTANGAAKPKSRVEIMRDDRIRQEELRQRHQEKQLEARLTQLRAAEERRLAEELTERTIVFQRRLGELQDDEQQERAHYIVPNEAHERTRITSQLRKIVVAYHNACGQQAFTAAERDRRRAFDFDYIAWTFEAWLLKKEGAGRCATVQACREERAVATAHFEKVLAVLAAQCLQRKALDTESDYFRGRLYTQEHDARARIAFFWREAIARHGTVAAMERQARAMLSVGYWDHKVSVMLEREEVKLRQSISWQAGSAGERLFVEEREAVARVKVATQEIEAFVRIAKLKAADAVAISQAVELAMERLQQRVDDLRRAEASLRNDVEDLTNELRDQALDARTRMLGLEDEHVATTQKSRTRVLELEGRVNALLQQQTRTEDQLQDNARAHAEEVRRLELKLAEANMQNRELRLRAEELEANHQLGPSLRVQRQGSSTTGSDAAPDSFALPGPVPAARQRDAASPPGSAGRGRRESTANGEPQLRATVEAQHTTIATLKRRIVALEAIVEENAAMKVAETRPSPPQASSNRELVSLLCAENKRLLDTNAALLDENRTLAKQQHSHLAAATVPSILDSPLAGSDVSPVFAQREATSITVYMDDNQQTGDAPRVPRALHQSTPPTTPRTASWRAHASDAVPPSPANDGNFASRPHYFNRKPADGSLSAWAPNAGESYMPTGHLRGFTWAGSASSASGDRTVKSNTASQSNNAAAADSHSRPAVPSRAISRMDRRVGSGLNLNASP